MGGSHLLESSPCLTFEETDTPERAGGLLGVTQQVQCRTGRRRLPPDRCLGFFHPLKTKLLLHTKGGTLGTLWASVCALCTCVLEDVMRMCQSPSPGLLPRGPPFESSPWLQLPSWPGPPHSVPGERAESGVASWAFRTWVLPTMSRVAPSCAGVSALNRQPWSARLGARLSSEC